MSIRRSPLVKRYIRNGCARLYCCVQEEIGSVVGVLDQAALLAQLDQRLGEEPGMTEAEAFNRAIATAHDEDISAWAGAIENVFQQSQIDSLSLIELQKRLGMPLVKVWLALLLGGYEMEQQGEFYERSGLIITQSSGMKHTQNIMSPLG
jgi:hypothetical protein